MTAKLNARDTALAALRDRAGNVTAHLERLLGQSDLSPADKGFARELALGAVRRRGTLQAVLTAFLRQPPSSVPAPLTEVLHLALYQILFLNRVPEFAAVNEAVEQAGRYSGNRGLVNAILRNVLRELAPTQQGVPDVDARVVPVSPNTSLRFRQPVFADPDKSPASYLAQAFSLPPILAKRWTDRMSPAGAAAVAQQANARAPFVLRVNLLKTTLADAMANLDAANVAVAPHANGISIVLKEHANVTELELFREGLVQPQDPTATAVSLAASPKPGANVLDFCAAPGTKTTHLAQLMQNRGSILAIDVSEEKLQNIRDNCARMGVTIVTTRLAELAGGLAPASFDLVLADVPCSNTGVLARRAEARWRFDERQLGQLVRDQQTLAGLAAQFVAPGGRLVYSTCSIEPEECGQVARSIQSRFGHMRLVEEKLTLPAGADDPTQWCDGGYYAILRAK